MVKASSKEIFRVLQAQREVGVTEIRSRAAAWFVFCWLLMIAGVFMVDQVVEWNTLDDGASIESLRSFAVIRELPGIVRELREHDFLPSAWIAANRRLLGLIQQTEDDLEEHGAVASWLRPWAQGGLLISGVGNEKVYPGRKSWLFYRPDVDTVTEPGFLNDRQLQRRTDNVAELEDAPHPNPLPAIIDFHHQLSARGIRLLVVPVPVKPELLPGTFAQRFTGDYFVRNSSYRLFAEQLHEAGVWVADVGQWMWEYQQQQHKPAFLLTDTHWTPSAMQWVARQLSAELSRQVTWKDVGTVAPATETISVTNRGDIAAMLDLPPALHPYPSETVALEQVLHADGSSWKADENAELLVLGDSFSNIYSLDAMGWGESAGWVEHLSLALQQPIDRIVRNDQGAFATRRILSRELARGRDRLAGKKVVVYQFASRELSFGDWRTFPLELKSSQPSAFLSLQPGEQRRARGLVREVSSVPRPGSVPYRDHVVSIHLVDIAFEENPESFTQAVVFMRSMKDNVWTGAARLKPGDEVECLLSSWDDVAEEMDGLNRSELDELELQLQEPLWGKLLEE